MGCYAVVQPVAHRSVVTSSTSTSTSSPAAASSASIADVDGSDHVRVVLAKERLEYLGALPDNVASR